MADVRQRVCIWCFLYHVVCLAGSWLWTIKQNHRKSSGLIFWGPWMNFMLVKCLTLDQKMCQQTSFCFSTVSDEQHVRFYLRWGCKDAWILKYSQRNFEAEVVWTLWTPLWKILVIKVSAWLVNVMWGQVWGCNIIFLLPLQPTRVPSWSLGKFTFHRAARRSHLNANVVLIAEQLESLLGEQSLWCESAGGVSSARSPKAAQWDHNQVCTGDTGGRDEEEVSWSSISPSNRSSGEENNSFSFGLLVRQHEAFYFVKRLNYFNVIVSSDNILQFISSNFLRKSSVTSLLVCSKGTLEIHQCDWFSGHDSLMLMFWSRS